MTTAYRRYALALMTTVYGLNLTERVLMTLLIEPMRIDLALSDTQVGLVTGIVFGVFYVVAGLPLSRLADRGNRSLIAAGSIGLWGATMLCFAFVGSFAQLLAARLAVAVGEAGCKPPTYSLVGDYFPGPAERTRAMTVYWLSNPVSALFGFIIGGWLNQHFGWRHTFLIMGLPGIAIAVLFWLTLREPRQARAAGPVAAATPPASSLWHAFLLMWRQATARNVMIALILFYTLGHGLTPWYGAFLIRSHGMATSELGLWLGLIMGGGGIVGITLGGYIASRFLGENERGQLMLTGTMVMMMVPLLAAFLFLPNRYHALAMLVPYMALMFFLFAPTFALFQRLLPANVRATTLAIVMTLVHLISMGVGPQVVGIVSDLLKPTLGTDSLRYGMIAVSLVAIPAGCFFWLAARTVARDLAASEAVAAGSIENRAA